MNFHKPWNEEIERLKSLVSTLSEYCKKDKLKRGVERTVIEYKFIFHSWTYLPYNLRTLFNPHLL
jgi:hypothetical protein